jgi:hypothetical protein
VICFEEEKDSRLTPKNEVEDLLLSSMTESTLSRVLTATSAREVGVIFSKLYVGTHASTAVGGTMSYVSVALAM